MKNFNLKYNNHSTLAQFLFDEITLWASRKDPNSSLPFLIRDIEKILDKVFEDGYNKGRNIEKKNWMS